MLVFLAVLGESAGWMTLTLRVWSGFSPLVCGFGRSLPQGVVNDYSVYGYRQVLGGRNLTEALAPRVVPTIPHSKGRQLIITMADTSNKTH